MAVSHQLTSRQLVNYDPGQPGIAFDLTLQMSSCRVDCQAKVDTGSAFCIFSRKVGEDLGVDIESGLYRMVGTVTGTFAIYLHEVSLTAAGFRFNSARDGFRTVQDDFNSPQASLNICQANKNNRQASLNRAQDDFRTAQASLNGVQED